jgi:RNA polymerase sigma-70 factor (ECF subfamily)
MKTYEENTNDAELLTRFAAGEEEAFRTLVSRYKNGLYAFLHRFLNNNELIEDIFQETFLQLFTSRESFDQNRPLRPWLFTIAANKAKDALRKQHRTPAITIGTITDSEQMSFEDVLNSIAVDTDKKDAGPYDNIERDETAALVRKVIANMPESLREILVLAYFNKFSYKQMSDILSIPIGTVKSRLHAAIGRFSKDWTESSGSQKE